ncbi:hypothetical protein [Streptomyces sp. GQFP]|uniref:hypothetical protein n=1 Tax=Streptomyces sp. GQFP TaxID=2907545 RepID=UPI001F2992F9|nr:hypothetical protein [Streptomyces sp. GQFP]UIX29942.1 hypothetical protein LUX31_07785 [Streptomyces sp. GQFP]
MDRSPFARFGERASELLESWQTQNHRKLSAPAFLDDGGSGALLASVTVRDSDPLEQRRRRMIIKLCASDEEASVEPGGLKAAWLSGPAKNESCPSFPETHLVKQLYDPMPVNDAWMMFQEIAGDGQDMVTLAAVVRQRQSRLPDIAAAVAGSLLSDWNPDDKGGEPMTAAEFVAALLDRRLAPNGPLAQWARDELGISFSDASITLPGRSGTLPNPLHLKDGCGLSRGQVEDPLRGRAHGDLHPGNIMVPEHPDAPADSYRLIDLTRFDKDALLVRDPVHLMLYLVGEFLPHLTDEAREEVLALLLGREADGLLIPQGLRRIVDGIRDAPGPWLKIRALGPGWAVQWTLALQACALMFCTRSKKYDDRDRRWFFRLAAEAAAESDRRFGVDSATARVVNVRPPSVPTAAVTGPAADREATLFGRTTVTHQPSTTPKTPETADGDAILRLLDEIRYTFERPLEQLASARALWVAPELMESIRTRAIGFKTVLGRLRPPSKIAWNRVDDILRSLRTVADKANDVRNSLGPISKLSLTLPQHPANQGLQALVNALDDLLGDVRSAWFLLSPPTSEPTQATTPIRPTDADAEVTS